MKSHVCMHRSSDAGGLPVKNRSSKTISKRVLRVGAVVVMATTLSGCVTIHPALQIASWALDGISYLATGKSVTDHGISVVAQKDCALWRGVTEGQVCREADAVSGVQIASAEPVEPVIDAQVGILHAPVESVEIAALNGELSATDLAAIETAAGTPAAAPTSVAPMASAPMASAPVASAPVAVEPVSGLFLVVASFKERVRAEVAMTRASGLDAHIIPANVAGQTRYRVAVGPFPREELGAMREGLKGQGFKDAWAVHMELQVELQGPETAEAKKPSSDALSG